MRKILVLVLMFVLMFGLVVGAGYSISVPATVTSPSTSSPGGGGAGLPVANATVNETTSEGVIEEGVSGREDDDIGVGTADFVKSIGWGTVLIVLGVLAVIGGTAWYVLKDKRKGFVEVKTKERK